jgi:hypothetical protein
MKKNEFVTLCLKIIGILFLLDGIVNLPHFLSSLTEPYIAHWDNFVSPLLEFICGIILFFKSSSFTSFMVNIKEESEIQFNPSDNTMRMALQVLGFYILAQAIPGFFQILVNATLYHFELVSIPKHLRQEQQYFINLVGPTVEALIGIWLILGSRFIMHQITKLRNY